MYLCIHENCLTKREFGDISLELNIFENVSYKKVVEIKITRTIHVMMGQL